MDQLELNFQQLRKLTEKAMYEKRKSEAQKLEAQRTLAQQGNISADSYTGKHVADVKEGIGIIRISII